MEKKFSEIISDYLRDTLKKFIPIFWIPGVGDKLLDKLMNSYALSLAWKGWVMLSLM
ncbi:MAG: hypothetical protein MJ115_03675 [Clostridia bacterium]|nr:hypothetical protein [Clostridia bacterium]